MWLLIFIFFLYNLIFDKFLYFINNLIQIIKKLKSNFLNLIIFLFLDNWKQNSFNNYVNFFFSYSSLYVNFDIIIDGWLLNYYINTKQKWLKKSHNWNEYFFYHKQILSFNFFFGTSITVYWNANHKSVFSSPLLVLVNIYLVATLILIWFIII